ncbi:MAG: hypothetical protein ACFB0B_17760 [Thermonemataceae bacterium]
MSISEEEYRRYIQKVLDIQKNKDNTFLTDEDLEAIAEDLGILKQDILDARQNYLAKGRGHLKHHNWEHALQAFEEALMLGPNHEASLQGCAEAHYHLWAATQKREHKEEALAFAESCLNINPENQQAFYLISQMKKGNQETLPTNLVKQKEATPARFPRRFISFLFVPAVIALIVAIEIFSTDESTPERAVEQAEEIVVKNDRMIEESFIASNTQGPVIWVIRYTKEGIKEDNRTKEFIYHYYASLIDPATLQERKKVPLLKTTEPANPSQYVDIGRFYVFDNAVYHHDKVNNQLVIRDSYTGVVKGDLRTLALQYPVLNEGVSLIARERDNGFELTTKKGNTFFYYPASALLLSKEEQNAFRRDQKNQQGWVTSYVWTQEQQEKKFFFTLLKTKQPPFYSSNRPLRTSLPNAEPISKLGDRMFLEAELLYGDQEGCVIKFYKNTGADKLEVYLTRLALDGSVIWEKQYPKAVIFQKETSPNLGIYSHSQTVMQVLKVRNQLLLRTLDKIYTRGKRHRRGEDAYCDVFAAIDFQTGKLLWEYSPNCQVLVQ